MKESCHWETPGGLTRMGIVLFAVSMMMLSCGKRNPLDLDVSDIDISPVYHHFEEALFNIPDTLFFEQFPKIYQEFSPLFMQRPCDSLTIAEMLIFRTDPRFIELYERKREMMGDMKKEEADIGDILRHYRYYYKDAPDQQIYTHISGLDMNYLDLPVILNDTLAIISTDMYLGRDFEPYLMFGLPEYKRKWMEPGQIAPEFSRQLAYLRTGSPDEAETLLEQMVFHGKILYFMDAMMPDLPDTAKIRYTEKQLEWIEENQRNVWAYIVSNNMLYSSDQNFSKTFIQDAPFTSVFSESSPGRIGYWLGWQIVKKYMKKHPGLTLDDLMQENDAQKILTGSGFKPR